MELEGVLFSCTIASDDLSSESLGGTDIFLNFDDCNSSVRNMSIQQLQVTLLLLQCFLCISFYFSMAVTPL